MSKVRILRVVVASPGDVQAERDAVVRAAEEVNRSLGRDRGVRLEVYRWETDARPGFHVEGPQGIIDPKLKVEDCELLIAIFWKRFGTPTADGRTGTEHEFNLAHEAWKTKQQPEIMIYFNQQPCPPTESAEEIEQRRQVLRFKESLPKEALWWTYSGCEKFEELIRNHLADFLREQPLEAAAGVFTPLHQLPPPPDDFTGRAEELAELRAAIEQGGVHISGLQGQGGVGKTALALKLAEELKPNFPDAQIYLDLRGASPKPLGAAEAMAFVIRAFRPEAKLPEGEAELGGIYQSVLHGQRALLLMDNARDAAQVRPLLPPKSCALLVTSRQHFGLPGLHPKNLETLPPADAEALLVAIAPRINGHARAVARLCGHLPQALRLAAGALVERPSLDPAEYARRLSDKKKRLELLQAGDQSMAASIELSYGLLEPEMQQRWRTLAVFPDTFGAPAAAAVWGLEGDAAQDALDSLLQYSMVEWNVAAKRYRLHDLMHDFARGRLEASERDQAARSHAAHYVDVLWETDRLYKKGGDSVTQGLALFDLEWGNIRAGQSWAAEHAGQDPESARLCSRYPDAGVYCLNLRLHPRDWIGWLEAALAAARRLKDRRMEGFHLGNLGLAYARVGEYRRAIEFHEQGLAVLRELGDRRGEGAALGNLGLVYAALGETQRAIEYYEQDLVVAREIGDRRGEGNALGNLGNAYADLGETRRAIEYYEQHLAIAREIGDRRGEGTALGNLGNAYLSLGEYRRAIEYHEQAVAIDREIGDRRGKGQDLGNLGAAYYSLGETRRAIEYYEQRLAIAREIGDRRGEGNANGGLGNAYHSLGETRRAVEYLEQQLAITREIGDRRGEGNALFNMSVSLDKLGDRRRAIEHAQAALVIYEQIEDPHVGMVRKQLEEWKAIG